MIHNHKVLVFFLRHTWLSLLECFESQHASLVYSKKRPNQLIAYQGSSKAKPQQDKATIDKVQSKD